MLSTLSFLVFPVLCRSPPNAMERTVSDTVRPPARVDTVAANASRIGAPFSRADSSDGDANPSSCSLLPPTSYGSSSSASVSSSASSTSSFQVPLPSPSSSIYALRSQSSTYGFPSQFFSARTPGLRVWVWRVTAARSVEDGVFQWGPRYGTRAALLATVFDGVLATVVLANVALSLAATSERLREDAQWLTFFSRCQLTCFIFFALDYLLRLWWFSCLSLLSLSLCSRALSLLLRLLLSRALSFSLSFSIFFVALPLCTSFSVFPICSPSTHFAPLSLFFSPLFLSRSCLCVRVYCMCVTHDLYACMFVCMHVCICVYLCTYVCMLCMYIYVCMYIRMHIVC